MDFLKKCVVCFLHIWLVKSTILYNSECEENIRRVGLPRIWKDDNNLTHPLKYPLTVVSNEVHIKNVPARQEDNTKGSEFGDDLLGISEQGSQLEEIEKYTIETILLLSCLHQDSLQLADIIRNKLIFQPSKENYNLKHPIDFYTKHHEQVPHEVDRIVFNRKLKNGFFIEAGANNFERTSDSLYFEINHGWTGLLVEPHPQHFKEGLTKNRKAFSINTCLSPIPRTTTTPFSLSYAGLVLRDNTLIHSKLQCFPLYSILQALGNPTINYFSLDIEGGEYQVLQTIPWDKVDIQVFSIETHFAGKRSEGSRQDIINYMESVGYQYLPWGHKVTTRVIWPDIEHDLINDLFVKNGILVTNIYE
ncbi:uncharacterized protein LOC111714347 [Eurytemora carolleeae]|uniref:uncharacterized protein LOC111714347 n=1 Tax=Eurytemora carolleeae TaxID=1294199 RepID=UPI000C774A16|nr:uncharacterized protein LOC111714347 [Eurytemora carolleeae]|eukprot:XP_023345201.1 uncharacterized protein LOC111714347 [Eurytemora affinis]